MGLSSLSFSSLSVSSLAEFVGSFEVSCSLSLQVSDGLLGVFDSLLDGLSLMGLLSLLNVFGSLFSVVSHNFLVLGNSLLVSSSLLFVSNGFLSDGLLGSNLFVSDSFLSGVLLSSNHGLDNHLFHIFDLLL